MLKDKKNSSVFSRLNFEIARFICNPVKITSTFYRDKLHPLYIPHRSIIDYRGSRLYYAASDKTFSIRRKRKRRMFSPAFAPSRLTADATIILPVQLRDTVDGIMGRHELKFRPIHAKTGELRTELSDLRPACRVARGEDVNFMANLSAAIIFITQTLAVFVASQYFSIKLSRCAHTAPVYGASTTSEFSKNFGFFTIFLRDA